MKKSVSSKLILKLGIAFFLLTVLMGAVYMLITAYFAEKYFQETSQKLHTKLAQHLVNEKFKDKSPFTEEGEINKALFGDIMHDMMAVNQSIEVYLLDKQGNVLYSVVLDHDNPNAPQKKVAIAPIQEFIANEGSSYILGDDPRDLTNKKIFSAAAFNQNGKEGYIYITLISKAYEEVTSSLSSSYFIKLGLGATALAMVFTLIIGLLALWFLTKSLRSIIHAVRQFREGDLNSRVKNAQKSDLKLLATSFNNMADTIVANIEALQSVDKLRRELVANISHDLRTPLSILKGYIETLQIKGNNLADDEKEEYLQIILNNSDRLSLLISQLFEYSKLESKQIEPHKEPFSITDLALDLINSNKMIAKKKELSIELKAMDDVALVYADISLVERAIQNLLDNAMKFTPKKGEILMHISTNGNSILFNISDSGPGIPENDQAFIFERYKQARKNTPNEGAGLGLAIVKKIMELHDTSVRLVKSTAEGSTFQFVLPMSSV